MRLPRFVGDFLQKTWKVIWKPSIVALSFFALFLALVLGGTFLFMHHSQESPKRLAWRNSGSRDYKLNLPKLFPALEEGASKECKDTWKKYAANLNCQEQILSTAWDNGDANEVRKAKVDPWAYSEWVCLDACRRSITSMESPLLKMCNRHTYRFDIANYGKDGNMYFDKKTVPEGPVDTQRSLLERYHRLCTKPPRTERYNEWGTCAADLWMNWGVVDGRNEKGLEALSPFLRATRERTLIIGGKLTDTVKIIDGEKKYEVETEQRWVGPGVGQTQCGYCTIDWLERKMRSFEYEDIPDPMSGEAIGLHYFNEQMTKIIKRCEGSEGAEESA